MRKFLILSLVTALSFVACAQKGVVKDASRALKSEDLKEARVLIKNALENEDTANDPNTWKLAGDIGDKAFDLERTNEMLGKKSNPDVMYNGLMESYMPYLKADSLAELPDSKGRVRNRVRKDISSTLKANHPFFINGGIHFNEKQQFKKASEAFEMYWNIPTLEMFGEKDEFAIDSTYQTIKYYSIITAIQGEDHARALRLIKRATDEPFVENTAYEESDLYELMASEYIQLGDTASYMEVLNVGATKFTNSKYFIPNLINVYIREGESDKALDYLDQAIKNDPSNACDLNSVKAALYSEKEEFEKAEDEYKKALAQDENCDRALEGIAVSYILQAQNLKDSSAQQMTDRKLQAENDKKTIEFYMLALPHLEKFTANLKAQDAEEATIKSALIKLQNVYYNLSNLGVDKSKELDEVEEQLGTNQ